MLPKMGRPLLDPVALARNAPERVWDEGQETNRLFVSHRKALEYPYPRARSHCGLLVYGCNRNTPFPSTRLTLLRRVRHRLRNLADRLRLSIHSHHVIVLGTEKSGTSAVAHLLADRCGLSKTIDIPELWAPSVLPVLRGEISLADVVRRNPRPFTATVIKENYLVYMFDQVDASFPNARFIFVVRDPRDTVRSVLNRLAIPGDLAVCRPGDWQIPEGWSAVLDPSFCGLPWSAHYIDILAERWNLAAHVFLQQRHRIALVRYEDFISEKLATIDRVAMEIGLAPLADIAHRLDLPYQPAGRDRHRPWASFFGTNNLGRIETRCGVLMESFGYQARTGPTDGMPVTAKMDPH